MTNVAVPSTNESRVLQRAKISAGYAQYAYFSDLVVALMITGVVQVPVCLIFDHWALIGGAHLSCWLLLTLWYVPAALRRYQVCLTDRSLVMRWGIFFRTEKTVPLDRIQDLTLNSGPVSRLFGCDFLSVQTAGSSMVEAILGGIENSREFRDIVLRQRDEVLGRKSVYSAARS